MVNGQWIQDGYVTSHASPYSSTSPVAGVAGTATGDGVQIGMLFGVCVSIANQQTIAASGDLIEVMHINVFKINKLVTDVVADGVPLYWDNSNRRVTVTNTANLFIGHALGAHGNGVTTALVRLNNASKAVG